MPEFRDRAQKISTQKQNILLKRIKISKLSISNFLGDLEDEEGEVDETNKRKRKKKSIKLKNYFKRNSVSCKNISGTRNRMACIKETVQSKAKKLKSVMNGKPKIESIKMPNFGSRRQRVIKNKEKAKEIIYMKNPSMMKLLKSESQEIKKSSKDQENLTLRSSFGLVSNSGFSVKNIQTQNRIMLSDEARSGCSRDQKFKIIDFMEKIKPDRKAISQLRIGSAKTKKVKFSFMNSSSAKRCHKSQLHIKKNHRDSKVSDLMKRIRPQSAQSSKYLLTKKSLIFKKNPMIHSELSDNNEHMSSSISRKFTQKKNYSSSFKKNSVSEFGSFKDGVRSLAFTVNSKPCFENRKKRYLKRKHRSKNNINVEFQRGRNIIFKAGWSNWQKKNIQKGFDRFVTEAKVEEEEKKERMKFDFFEGLFKKMR